MAWSIKDHAVHPVLPSTQHASVRKSPSQALLMKWTKTSTSYHSSLSPRLHYSVASLCSYQNKALVAHRGCVCVCVLWVERQSDRGFHRLVFLQSSREKHASSYRHVTDKWRRGNVWSLQICSLSHFFFFLSLSFLRSLTTMLDSQVAQKSNN